MNYSIRSLSFVMNGINLMQLEEKKIRGFILKTICHLRFCQLAWSTILAACNTDVIDRT